MFRRRLSCRKFRAGRIALDQVASLLDAAYGPLGPLDVPDPEAFPHRTVPSAGGLFPLELFVILRRIDGAEDGLHHYDANERRLSLLERGDLFPRVEPMFYTFPFIAEANIVIALAAIFPRTQTKYGPRGYRYVLLEAGHVGQNICLRAAELDLATLCMGGFVDSALNGLLGLKAPEEGVVYTIAAGLAGR
jgi:SagB-type dehydrogenase family enzyme